MKTALRCLFVSLAGVVAVSAQEANPPAAAGVQATPAAVVPAGPKKHSISVDVRTAKVGGDTKSTNGGLPSAPGNGMSATSVSTNSMAHQTSIEITVSNFDRASADTVQVEWYFFAAEVRNSIAGKPSVFDKGSKDVTIPPGGRESFVATSKAVSTVTTKTLTATSSTSYTAMGGRQTSTSLSGTSNNSGTKITGWMVRFLADGKLLQVKASDFKYEEFGKKMTSPNDAF